jgi:long-chain fatty acid transport protein
MIHLGPRISLAQKGPRAPMRDAGLRCHVIVAPFARRGPHDGMARRPATLCSTRLLRLTVLSMILQLCPQECLADGWKVQAQGVAALGLSYAGRSILSDDASAVWFNPAAMTRLTREWTITSGAPLVTYRLDYRDQGSTSVLGQPLTGSSTADGGRSALVPHVYVARKVNDHLWAGFGFNAPYGLGSDYGETWIGRYHATKTELTVVNLNPTFAIKLTDRLSVGVGLDIQRSDAVLANMIDFGSFGAALGLPLTPQGHDGKIELTAGDWSTGYDLSLAWQPGERARVGLTYRSQIEHTIRGRAQFDVPAEAALLTAGGTLFADTEATAVLPMPHELSASASYDIASAWVLVGDVTWTDWSRFQQLRVAFANPAQPAIVQRAAFEDSVRTAVGIIYRASPRWQVRAGGLYETTPVPDATRTPRLPEIDNAGISVGASFRPSARWDVDFSFSHLLPHNAPIAIDDPGAGQLAGQVRWRLDILGVSVNLRF